MVSDTLMPNGKTYYRVTPENFFFFKQFIRADSTGIYYYEPNCNDEWLYYNYQLPVGEYQLIRNNCAIIDSGKMNKEIDSTASIFGNSSRYMRFYFNGGIDNDYSIELALKYGFTAWNAGSWIGNYYSYLLGCKLSGIVYGTLTSVDEEPKLPSDFSLYQNYPNPFNPSTKISWQSPVSGWQTIKLYDALGREIDKIVDGFYGVGFHSKLFIVNSKIPSGVYFYQLKAGGFTETKKMILLK